MKVLVTGASGFIGRNVVSELLSQGHHVRIARHNSNHLTANVTETEEVALSGPGYVPADWKSAVFGCNRIVHLAGLANVMRDVKRKSGDDFYLANVQYARACCEAGVQAGVGRFIFISTVGVHGGDSNGLPFRADSHIEPHTLYAKSKADAERMMLDVVGDSNMELTIIRPPLVYGPEAPGNFSVLLRAIASGWPLPLGLLTSNRRSFVGVDNLVDLMLTCLEHPAAANEAFLVSDGEDLSTSELIKRLSAAMGRPTQLFQVPVGWLGFGATVLGKRDLFQSLCGSLQVDISKTRNLLNWKPKVSVDEGLRLAVSRSFR